MLKLEHFQKCAPEMYPRASPFWFLNTPLPVNDTDGQLVVSFYGCNYTVSPKKTCHHTFVHIFAIYGPILKILSLAHSVENLQQSDY